MSETRPRSASTPAASGPRRRPPAGRAAARVLRPGGAQRADRPPGAPAARARGQPEHEEVQVVANEAYRAVFLRVHPTGKMVLSLTTESDGKEPQYAQLVAEELGVPALDVKVVPADTDRFGDRPRLQHQPRPTGRRRRSPAPATRSATRRSCSPAWRWEPLPETLAWENGAWVARRRRRSREGHDDRRHRAVRARHRRAAARRRGRARRAGGLPRLRSAVTTLRRRRRAGGRRSRPRPRRRPSAPRTAPSRASCPSRVCLITATAVSAPSRRAARRTRSGGSCPAASGRPPRSTPPVSTEACTRSSGT